MLWLALARPLRRIRPPGMQVPATAMRLRLLTRLRGRTTRRIPGTMRRASLMHRELTTRRIQAITAVGTIARVAPRIRAGKKRPLKHVKVVRKGGRPPRADALKLREKILRVATELFLEQG